MSRNQKRNGLPKAVLLLVILFAIASIPLMFRNETMAPLFTPRENNNDTVNGVSYEPVSHGSAEPYEPPPEGYYPYQPYEPYEPYEPPEPTHVTIYMDESDAFQGSLILINHDNAFDFAHLSGLVPVVDYRSDNLRLSHAYHMLHYSIIDPLNAMVDAFREATGLNNVGVISAFRDYERQREIMEDFIERMGRDEALMWVAIPGFSEHHAGLAFDLGIFIDGVPHTFHGLYEYSWFNENAHYFGFILRYPENRTDVTGVAFEPWHFRYVGRPHAYIIWSNGFVFEEYIDFIRMYDQNFSYTRYFEGVLYEIFFTDELQIDIPIDNDFYISGNNVDGFIVTIIHIEY